MFALRWTLYVESINKRIQIKSNVKDNMNLSALLNTGSAYKYDSGSVEFSCGMNWCWNLPK